MTHPLHPVELTLPARTVTGGGKVNLLAVECAVFGRRGLVVHGRSLETGGVLARILAAQPAGLEIRNWAHAGGEPTLAQLDALLAMVRAFQPDWVAAVGGGSVIDLAKAAAGLVDAPLPPVAYHDGAAVPPGRIPFVAVPTTAGTGSEATFVSVLTNEKSGVKKSFRHPSFVARTVILDPDLLASCPGPVLAASGMDALTQAIESFISRGATGVTDRFALDAVRLVSGSLCGAHQGNSGCFEDLLIGSFYAGIALSNARLGLVHGLAHPLGARYHQAHGLVCAVCLVPVMAFNRPAIGERYDRLSEAIGGELLPRLGELQAGLGIRSPFKGQPMPDRAAIIRETLESGSTKANPRPVTAGDVENLLDRIGAE